MELQAVPEGAPGGRLPPATDAEPPHPPGRSRPLSLPGDRVLDQADDLRRGAEIRRKAVFRQRECDARLRVAESEAAADAANAESGVRRLAGSSDRVAERPGGRHTEDLVDP